jgi:hypothetical protein
MTPDCVFFDENHFAGTTDLAEKILNVYLESIKIYMTATYNKTLNKWNIPNECQFFWSLEDEKMCKDRHIEELLKKHDYIDFKYDPNELKYYDGLPTLEIITNHFETGVYEKIKKKIKSSAYGFSWSSLFTISNGEFKFENEVKSVLRLISGSHKENDYKDGDASILSRIDNIVNSKNSRKPKCHIWFLPENNISDISNNLKKLIQKNRLMKNRFNVICVNSTEKIKELQIYIKNEIEKLDDKALIILAGKQLNLGITIEECDVVFLMHDSITSDKVYQQMMRCMTESKEKRVGIVVDFNIGRVVDSCINMSTKNINSEDKFKYVIKNNLINLDSDYFVNEELKRVDEILTNLVTIWKEHDIKNGQICTIKNEILNNYDNIVIKFNEELQQNINRVFKEQEHKKGKNGKIALVDSSDDIQKLPTGSHKEKIKQDTDVEKEQSPKKIEQVHIDFFKQILPDVLSLLLVWNLNSNSKCDMITDYDNIINDTELLNTFNEKIKNWYCDECVLIIKYAMLEIMQNKKVCNVINNIYMTLKEKLVSLIDRPRDLLICINENLKPKEKEKKEYGEVFTPLELVDRLLSKIPDYIWEDPSLKWLDPANGIGNFTIVVYLKLYESLAHKIPDNRKRKKHIIENMLYVCDINKTNNRIFKTIFDINNEYRMNILNGDFLESNMGKFDIIVGNPPYQDNSGNKGRGHALWVRFVEKCLNILNPDGFLVFIHPPNWRQLGNNLLERMLSRQILYLEMHDSKDGQKIFNCSISFDMYVLQNRKCTTSTEIVDVDSKHHFILLKNKFFVPNKLFNEVYSLMDEDGKKLDVIRDRSSYATERKNVSKIKTEIYKYPLINSIKAEGPVKYYSSTNKNGHFKRSKFIFSNGTGFLCDPKGKYGLTEWAYCIFDSPDKLEKIEKCFKNERFNEIIDAIKIDSMKYNIAVMKLFKNDFYKYFQK